MGTFVNSATGVQFSVNDSKDERYRGDGYEAPKSTKASVKKAAPSKPSK